ncbi:MAG TPA: tetraacyldisaccharide 4'-kinase [Rhizomicrobium sp.]|nr:tetraacyldisaccharide 4'-kinase [Rhizomicrobium sp.]
MLAPLGWAYGASVAYRARHARPYRSRAKVICVGNLTAGGTGKTPIALEIGRLLMARGIRTVFLTRGYGGRVRGPRFVATGDRFDAVGDEPLLLAAVAPVIVASDRAAGARLADAQGFEVIIMDDGHQNFALAKDLSLVVIASGLDNTHMLPAGPLREPVAQGLKRADAVIIHGEGTPALNLTIPLVESRLVPLEDVSWSGKRVIAFAGIANPERFFALLSKLGASVVEVRAVADHHRYSATEIGQLMSRAYAEKALLVTTEKDFVRLSPAQREGIEQLRVRAEFRQPEVIARLIDKIVPRPV